jgi:hypothetical protein
LVPSAAALEVSFTESTAWALATDTSAAPAIAINSFLIIVAPFYKLPLGFALRQLGNETGE